MLAHHPTGWRKLGIQTFGGDSKQENTFSVQTVVCPISDKWFQMQALILKRLTRTSTRMSTRMAHHVGFHDSQLGLRYSSQAKMVIDKNTNRLGRQFFSFFFALYMFKLKKNYSVFVDYITFISLYLRSSLETIGHRNSLVSRGFRTALCSFTSICS